MSIRLAPGRLGTPKSFSTARQAPTSRGGLSQASHFLQFDSTTPKSLNRLLLDLIGHKLPVRNRPSAMRLLAGPRRFQLGLGHRYTRAFAWERRPGRIRGGEHDKSGRLLALAE